MTRDQLIDALRALGVRTIPDNIPPFRTWCACRTHRGTRTELPAGHDWHQAHGGRGCTQTPAVAPVNGTGLTCSCGQRFGMNAEALMAHTRTEHGREATRDERTPK